MKYRRIITIVLDSMGIGAMPDADKFGDQGVDTLGHISEKMEKSLTYLQALRTQ